MKKTTTAKTKNVTAKAEFRRLSGAEQQLSLMKMCNRCKTIAHCHSPQPLYVADWLETRDDFMTAAAEAYISLCEIFEEHPSWTLPKAMYTACWRAINRIYSAELKACKALVRADNSDDAEDGDVVYDIEAYSTESAFPDPESYNIFKITLENCITDEVDEDIIYLRCQGLNNSDIGEIVGMSRQSVEKRLAKMRREFKGL